MDLRIRFKENALVPLGPARAKRVEDVWFLVGSVWFDSCRAPLVIRLMHEPRYAC